MRAACLWAFPSNPVQTYRDSADMGRRPDHLWSRLVQACTISVLNPDVSRSYRDASGLHTHISSAC